MCFEHGRENLSKCRSHREKCKSLRLIPPTTFLLLRRSRSRCVDGAIASPEPLLRWSPSFDGALSSMVCFDGAPRRSLLLRRPACFDSHPVRRLTSALDALRCLASEQGDRHARPTIEARAYKRHRPSIAIVRLTKEGRRRRSPKPEASNKCPRERQGVESPGVEGRCVEDLGVVRPCKVEARRRR
jgi:hypothetical protein